MTQPWIPRETPPVDVPWYTLQFFLDSDSGDVDEVSYQVGSRKLRCTCSPPEGGACQHIAVVQEHRLPGGIFQMDIGPGGIEEAERLNLDAADPAVLRDLLRRYGHIVVL
jgi:hypothetical protein